jgi:type I restriction enzyme S subunit
MLPIGKLFDIEKGELQSTKCIPGDYDFITAAEEWKTHNEYTHECEALIFAAAASGSLGRTHYVDGKFTTSDLCYILTPKNDEKYPLNLSFYHFVFNSLRPSLVAATKSGTSKESINQANFKNYEIPYFDIELQDFWIGKLKNTLGLKSLLGSELAHQQTLLKKLRQQILQEAIEGKLTADWRAQNPDVKPASELLKRIAAEKAQQVKDKKIKAQKPLPLISDEEKPFELPQGWEWCRLATIAGVGTGATPLTSDPSYYGGRINWMTSADTGQKYVTTTKARITEKAILETNCKVYPSGTLVIAMYGQGKTRGQITELKIEAATNQACAAISVHCFTESFNQFIKMHFWKIYDEIRELARGGAQPNLNMEKIKSSIIALPPLDEQQAIVTKVEKLLALCDQLETQIIQNQSDAEQLMQAVLKEAFAQNREAVPAAKLG